VLGPHVLSAQYEETEKELDIADDLSSEEENSNCCKENSNNTGNFLQ
jgi:hypothetical protein